MTHRPTPPLHVVTDDEVAARAEFIAIAGGVLKAGGAYVALHLRAPHASGRRLHHLASRLMEIARGTGSLIVINDRVDVAMSIGANGVQLGRRSILIPDARRLVGGDARIGASVHDAGEARRAVDEGADWLLAGHVYPTRSHPGQPGAGLGMIREMAALGRPVIGIGGITPERAREVRDEGASGVAAIRGIWDQTSPSLAARAYIEAWQS